MAVILLVLGGKVETHAEVLVIPKWGLLGHIVEYDNWPRHLNLLLVLNIPLILNLIHLKA